MIYLVCPNPVSYAGEIVAAALARSCSPLMVSQISLYKILSQINRSVPLCCIFIDPPETWSELILRCLKGPNAKIILFGAIPQTLARHLGVRNSSLDETLNNYSICSPAPLHNQSESKARIIYHNTIKECQCPIDNRPLTRYDFAEEWNNLGYGAILTDQSIWSIRQKAIIPPESSLSDIDIEGDIYGSYCGLWDFPSSSLMWFNRPVGPVDSQEWRLIESFLAHHRHTELPCYPVISEIPYGYDAAVTMRLDCDENVSSARQLFHKYQEWNVPLSLAILSGILKDREHTGLICDVKQAGGGILTHSANHLSEWGGTYEAALEEAVQSALSIERNTGVKVRYAVSPFHQTPHFARAAMADAGYSGCIGGIIRNDPDFLMARAGIPPGSHNGFIGHSQQCMLHGDCIRQEGDPLIVYKKAFMQSKKGKSFFGFLDHPFSDRYQYGWKSEDQRINMHKALIDYMRCEGDILFCSEDQAMDFLVIKSEVNAIQLNGKIRVELNHEGDISWPLAIEYATNAYCLSHNALIL